MTEEHSPNFDDRISAYLDGELASEEANAVRQELKQTASAQEVLREYTDLRNLMRELPLEEVPADLHRQVMLRLRQGPRVVKSGRPAVWRIAVPLFATAACIFVLLRFNPPGPDLNSGDAASVQVAANQDREKSLVSNEKAPESREDDGLIRDNKNLVAGKSDQGMLSESNTISDAIPHPVPEGVELGVVAKLADPAIASETMVSSDGKQTFEISGVDLAKLKVGETVQGLRRTGEEVSVVKLLVVDQNQALNALQLILASQEVSREPLESKSERPQGQTPFLGQLLDEKEIRKVEEDVSLVAVYVEATESQLTAALEELKRENQQFLRVAVDETLATNEVSRVLEEQLRGASETDVGKNDTDAFYLAESVESKKQNLPAQASKPVPGSESQTTLHFARSGQQVMQLQPSLFDLNVRGKSVVAKDKSAGQVLESGSGSKERPAAIASQNESKRMRQDSVRSPSVARSAQEGAANPAWGKEQEQLQVLFVLKQRPQPVLKARLPMPRSTQSPPSGQPSSELPPAAPGTPGKK